MTDYQAAQIIIHYLRKHLTFSFSHRHAPMAYDCVASAQDTIQTIRILKQAFLLEKE